MEKLVPPNLLKAKIANLNSKDGNESLNVPKREISKFQKKNRSAGFQ